MSTWLHFPAVSTGVILIQVPPLPQPTLEFFPQCHFRELNHAPKWKIPEITDWFSSLKLLLRNILSKLLVSCSLLFLFVPSLSVKPILSIGKASSARAETIWGFRYSQAFLELNPAADFHSFASWALTRNNCGEEWSAPILKRSRNSGRSKERREIPGAAYAVFSDMAADREYVPRRLRGRGVCVCVCML